MTPLIDRRPEKLRRLTLIGIKMSTPEQMLCAYNSIVDAYNALIDAHNRLLDEKIAELKGSKHVREWVYDHDLAGMHYYRCTNCADNNAETFACETEVIWWRFCPRCGAKMFTKEELEND